MWQNCKEEDEESLERASSYHKQESSHKFEMSDNIPSLKEETEKNSDSSEITPQPKYQTNEDTRKIETTKFQNIFHILDNLTSYIEDNESNFLDPRKMKKHKHGCLLPNQKNDFKSFFSFGKSKNEPVEKCILCQLMTIKNTLVKIFELSGEAGLAEDKKIIAMKEQHDKLNKLLKDKMLTLSEDESEEDSQFLEDDKSRTGCCKGFIAGICKSSLSMDCENVYHSPGTFWQMFMEPPPPKSTRCCSRQFPHVHGEVGNRKIAVRLYEVPKVDTDREQPVISEWLYEKKSYVEKTEVHDDSNQSEVSPSDSFQSEESGTTELEEDFEENSALHYVEDKYSSFRTSEHSEHSEHSEVSGELRNSINMKAPLSNEEKELVSKTWTILEMDMKKVGKDFFYELFDSDPGYEAFFEKFNKSKGGLMDDEKFAQHIVGKVMRSIGDSVKSLDKMAELETTLYQLGQRHKERNVKKWYIENAKGILHMVIGINLAEHWTNDVNEAWRKTIDFIFSKIISGME